MTVNRITGMNGGAVQVDAQVNEPVKTPVVNNTDAAVQKVAKNVQDANQPAPVKKSFCDSLKAFFRKIVDFLTCKCSKKTDKVALEILGGEKKGVEQAPEQQKKPEQEVVNKAPAVPPVKNNVPELENAPQNEDIPTPPPPPPVNEKGAENPDVPVQKKADVVQPPKIEVMQAKAENASPQQEEKIVKPLPVPPKKAVAESTVNPVPKKILPAVNEPINFPRPPINDAPVNLPLASAKSSPKTIVAPVKGNPTPPKNDANNPVKATKVPSGKIAQMHQQLAAKGSPIVPQPSNKAPAKAPTQGQPLVVNVANNFVIATEKPVPKKQDYKTLFKDLEIGKKQQTSNVDLKASIELAKNAKSQEKKPSKWGVVEGATPGDIKQLADEKAAQVKKPKN